MRNKVATLPGKYELSLILSQTAVGPVELGIWTYDCYAENVSVTWCDKSNCYVQLQGAGF